MTDEQIISIVKVVRHKKEIIKAMRKICKLLIGLK